MISEKKTALHFIFITLILDVIGLSIVVPVLPRLIEQLIDGNISKASQWSGWLLFAYAIMQFICAPIVGNLSDKYGRRPVLLLSLLGFGIDYIFLWLAPTIWWLFLGRIIAGMFGASITTASAYIADISTNENRAKNFGMIGAAFGLGYIIGPVLSIISRNVPPNEQGELQGSLTSLMSVTSIIGPLLMTNLLTWFTGPAATIQFAGVPFLVGAILMTISAFIAINSLKKTFRLKKLIDKDSFH